MVPMDVQKWRTVTKYIKEQFNELTVEEQSAIDVLNDFWRNGNFDKTECEDNIKILEAESIKHGNNLDLKTNLQKFRELCKKYYTKEEILFKEFQKTLGGKPYNPIEIRHIETLEIDPIIEKKDETYGRLEYSNGYYIGELNHGLRHGKGKFFYENGDWDEGEWQYNELHGHAIRYIKDEKRTDEGEYRGNSRYGKGSITWEDGHKYIGGWNATGPNGYGEFYYPKSENVATYKGYFVNGLRQGKGKLTWSDGDWYDGDWDNHRMTGQGVKFYTNNRIDTGTFRDGERVGSGEMKWIRGDKYIGTWNDTERGLEGQGVYYFANGESENGSWVSGQWVKAKTFGDTWRQLGSILNIIGLITWIGVTILIWVTNGFFSGLIIGVVGFFCYGIFAWILTKIGMLKD